MRLRNRKRHRYERVSALESLEGRSLLATDLASTFARFDGAIPTADVSITLQRADFPLLGNTTRLGFLLEPASGSALDPAVVQIRDSRGVLQPAVYARSNLPNSPSSLALVDLKHGSYQVRLSGSGGSQGRYELSVFLAGDVDGDGAVDLADGRLLLQSLGKTATSPGYQKSADINLDGEINLTDAAHYLLNLGDRTRLNVLPLTASLSPFAQRLPSGQYITNTTNVFLSGTTLAGARVQLDSDGNGDFREGTVTAGASGSYSLVATLRDGFNAVSVRATDAFGQVRIVPLDVVVDRAAPLLTASLAIDTAPGGDVNADGITSKGRIAGTVDDQQTAVDSLRVQVNGTGPFFGVPIEADGSFSFSPNVTDGTHQAMFVATDLAGNTASTVVTYTLDTTHPDSPVNIQLTSQTDSGFSDSDGITNHVTPSIRGSAEAGSLVRLFIDHLLVGSATSDGSWTIPAPTLTEGAHTLTATAEDVAGNVSVLSSKQNIVIDTLPPPITAFDLDENFDTPPLGDGQTSLAAVTLAGITEPNVSVILLETGSSATSDALGRFEFTSVPLALGLNSFTARGTDLAGNSNIQSTAIERIDLNPDADPPVLTASLRRDTAPGGATNSDGITSEATIVGRVSDAKSGIASLKASIDGSSTLADVGFNSLGEFEFQRPVSDGLHTVQFIATDVAGNESTITVSFTLDTTSPLTPTSSLSADSDSAPIGDQQTSVRLVTLEGATDPGATVELLPQGFVTTADSLGQYRFPSVELSFGANILATRAVDEAGNSSEATMTLTRVPAASDRLLVEQGNFVSEFSQLIDLTPVAGSRTLAIDLSAVFDRTDTTSVSVDTLLVYLVDPANRRQTILDRGEIGTSLFALTETDADYLPDQVRFDANRVEIDLTHVEGYSQGLLLFQLLNLDQDENSTVAISAIENRIDPDAAPLVPVAQSSLLAEVGPSLNIAAMVAANSVQVNLQNIRFDAITARFKAELSITNLGAGLGREVALVLPDLPAGVQLVGASGLTPSGAPYLNLTAAMLNGGLRANESSLPVVVELDNSSLTRFALRPQVLIGSPNQPPVFAAIDPVTVMPGHRLEIPLSAADVNGDTVTWKLRATGPMPTSRLVGSEKLEIFPAPGEEGEYEFDLIATDGVLETTQTLRVTVQADTNRSTRISGQVLDTDGTPLVGVPISISRLTVPTDAEGRFIIELPQQLVPTEPFSITVPPGDPFFDPFNTGQEFMSFHRAGVDPTTGTDLANPRRHPNLVTSYLDASIVYGSDDERATALRALDGTGRLKTSPGDLLPFNSLAYFPDGVLENDNSGPNDPASMFAAGDVRSSENPTLTALHTVLVREHNRKADELASIHSDWSDEQLYQEARRFVGALIQHITYQEFLPQLVGAGALAPYSGYQPSVDPQVGTLFATAAFRLGHTQMAPDVQRLDDNGNPLPGGPLDLREGFFNTQPILADGIEPFLRGAAVQNAEEIDLGIIDSLRNFLFGPPGSGGLDLPAMTIQRGRDMGLPSYVQARADLGLSPVTSFAEITSNPAIQAALASTYGTVDKIDVFVGALAEEHEPGAMVGELLRTVLVQQFEHTRDGDRFWYENSQFTASELNEIRATTLSALIERNTTITGLSDNVFTTGVAITGPANAGTATVAFSGELRTLDGTGNHPTDLTRGATGDNLRIDASLRYADGIAAPSGADRPSARVITNALLASNGTVLSADSATLLSVFWGQLIAHDLSHSPTGVSNTLAIHGDDAEIPGKEYPFVAEKLNLMLEHPVYAGVENVIARPIYLPALDIAGGTAISASQDTTVSQEIAPGDEVTVAVKAGTLLTREGNPFTGVLSVTEVPANLTPAALPANLIPDTVVTIQPADMVFTTPAPLTLPNRSGLPPGTRFDLWSINPTTGVFDDVGDMEASADGQSIVTISGGIRNSSWHFAAPPPQMLTPGLEDGTGEADSPPTCPVAATSVVSVTTCSLTETHTLPSYSSFGQDRALTLVYSADRVISNKSFRFSTRVPDLFQGRQAYLGATLSISNAKMQMEIPSANTPPEIGIRNLHVWSPESLTISGRMSAGLLVDTTDLADGIYNYTMSVGGFITNAGITSVLTPLTGSFLKVSSSNSPYGHGWGIAGLQIILESGSTASGDFAHSVVIVDGSGTELTFRRRSDGGFESPTGDFSTLTQTPDGTYRRRTPDGMLYAFDANRRLASVTDPNGNQTLFEYAAAGELTRVIDPAGLVTTLSYSNGRLDFITLPDGRVTDVTMDAQGNLSQVTDPDSSQRTFHYNDVHLMTGETTPRGLEESVVYDSNGRVIQANRRDGSVMTYSPADLHGVYNPLRLRPLYLPPVFRQSNLTTYTTPGGNVVTTELNRNGQAVRVSDSLGFRTAYERDAEERVTRVTDWRGADTRITYDPFGNVTSTTEEVTVQDGIFDSSANPSADGLSFPMREQAFGPGNHIAIPVDVNGDSMVDIVSFSGGNILASLGDGTGGFNQSPVTSSLWGAGTPITSMQAADVTGDGNQDLVVFRQESGANGSLRVLQGNGTGTFVDNSFIAVTDVPSRFQLTDINQDGRPDVLSVRSGTDQLIVYYGTSGGSFAPATSFDVGDGPRDLAFGDVTGDGWDDVVVTNRLANTISVLENDRDGGFRALGRIATNASPTSVELADVSGDDLLDVVVTYSQGTGSFQVFRGLGAGSFVALGEPVVLPSIPQDVVVFDMGEDGANDIFLPLGSSAGSLNVVYTSDDAGVFARAATVSGNAADGAYVVDVNHDGLDDIVAAGERTQLLIQDRRGGFRAPERIALGASPGDSLLADLNNDGNLDLAVVNRDDNSVSIRLGNGNGQFGEPTTTPVGTLPGRIISGDLDQDGRVDLAVSDRDSGSITVLFGDGRGGVDRSEVLAAAVPGFATDAPLAVGDINGDGRLDLLLGSWFYATISIFYANSSGGFLSPVTLAWNDRPTDIVLADFNHDGQLDIAATIQPNGVALRLNTGGGTFGNVQRFLAGFLTSKSTAIDAGDINGDGHIDIVFENESQNSPPYFLLGDGLGNFSGPESVNDTSVPVNITDLRLADVNGDHALDIVTADSLNDRIAIFLGDGVGGFKPRLNFVAGDFPVSVNIGDIDSDGQSDILSALRQDNAVVVFESLPAARTQLLTNTFEYEPGFSRLTRHVDAEGRVYDYQINPANGNLLSVTGPLGYSMSYTYTPQGFVDTTTDTLGRVTDFDYDSLGRLNRITSAVGTADEITVSYTHDAAGNVATFTDAKGNVTEYFYDAKNRLKRERDPLGFETRYSYDDAGNVLSITDALNRTTTFTYDAMDRLLSVTDPLGNRKSNQYDQAGNLISQRDPLGHLTQHAYDVAQRRTSTTDPDGGVARFQYDRSGNLTTVIDQSQNLTSFFYDERNRLVREMDPLNKSSFYLYDGVDNLVRQRDRLTRQTAFDYDELDRMVREEWLDPNTMSIVHSIDYAYDLMGNILTASDANSALSYDYDSLDRTKSVDNLGTPGVPRVVLSYEYDRNSNVRSVSDSIDGVLTGTTNYQYDKLNRLLRIDQSGLNVAEKRVDFTYNPLGQTESLTRFSDLAGNQKLATSTYAFDGANRISAIRHKDAADAVFAFYDYGYDAASRITSINDIDGFTNYQYDQRDQLTGADRSAGDPRGDEAYDYDASGNRTSSHLHGTDYETGTGNRLASDGSYNYLYDAEGNLLVRTEIATGSSRHFSWDHRNRLTSIEDRDTLGVATQLVEFTYDVFDRRISKSVDSTPLDSVDGTVTHFVYDGEDVILDFVDTDGSGPAVPTQENRYLHGPGWDNLIAFETAAGAFWIAPDRLGSTRQILDSTGAVAQNIRYDSFGNVLVDSSPLTRYLFTGRELDSETRLTYFRARYYDSTAGRFVNEDPIGFAGDDLNLGRYVGNRPISLVDPVGLLAFEDYWGGAQDVLKDYGGAISNAWDWYNDAIGGNFQRLAGKAGTAAYCGDYLSALGNLLGAASMFGIGNGVRDLGIVGLRGLGGLLATKAPGLIGASTRGLQKFFGKHGADFGLKGNWNPGRVAETLDAIKAHMAAAGTKAVPGTYRGDKVFHYVNPSTGLNVTVDLNGNLVSGWKLSGEQLESVINSGKLF